MAAEVPASVLRRPQPAGGGRTGVARRRRPGPLAWPPASPTTSPSAKPCAWPNRLPARKSERPHAHDGILFWSRPKAGHIDASCTFKNLNGRPFHCLTGIWAARPRWRSPQHPRPGRGDRYSAPTSRRRIAASAVAARTPAMLSIQKPPLQSVPWAVVTGVCVKGERSRTAWSKPSIPP